MPLKGHSRRHVFSLFVRYLHRSVVGIIGTSSTAHYGRDSSLVLFLFAIGRTDNLCQMEIQMDSVFQYHTVSSIHLRQPAQA